MSWLSPVQWAKWTWSAVTGGPGEVGQEGASEIKDDQANISDSEGNFGTPEAESPGVLKKLTQLDNCSHTVVPVDDGQPTSRPFLDKNSNREVDTLNNLTCSSPNNNSFSLDQNLNLSTRPGPGEGLPPSSLVPQPQALRPPSLSVLSPLSRPDPTEVDDEAPMDSDSSPDSNLNPSPDLCVDPDLFNGNMNSDPSLLDMSGNLGDQQDSMTQSPRMTNGTIITNSCKVKQSQSLKTGVNGQLRDAHRKGHATDEEKLRSSAGVKTDKDQSRPECSVSSRPAEADCCSTMYEDPGKSRSNKTGGSDTQKTGSQVLDSICISEAEKKAVLTLIREEIITKDVEVNDWKGKYEDSRQEVLEMRKIVAEYEKTIAQMIEDEQRNSMSSQKSLQVVTVEKDSALADLNSVERSLSDMFRRYENMKSTLDGFKKNEEVLKRCAQEYLTRVKQVEQRYQTLKVHAEEKLDRANEEIAQVRAKASSESVAMNASLRKEQMKMESTDRALEQKNQEIEELTKICDELIAKMGRVD